jgi:NAD(P)-dependent dehydrogenase (short-subunit alcohol dehydrogenase family)
MTQRKLEGRKALVSGGASGIGEATARLFAAEGAAVMIADIDDANGERVVREIVAAGNKAVYLHVDVTDRTAVRRMVHEAEAALGGLGILFNNAMTNPSSDYSEDQRWNLMLESGLGAYWAAATEAAPILARSGHGAIVSNASIAGARWGIEFASEAYSAAKAGVLGLSRKLAKRFGPDGVRSNAICPGIIETPRWRSPGWRPCSASVVRMKWPGSCCSSRATIRRSSRGRTSPSMAASRPRPASNRSTSTRPEPGASWLSP